MFRVYKILLAAFLATGCATSTGYIPSASRGDFGYSIEKIEKTNSLAAFFIGNSFTSKTEARSYSILAALDHCDKTNELVFLMADIVDGSTSIPYTAISTQTMTVKGVTSTHTTSTPAVHTVPMFALNFICVAKMYGAEKGVFGTEENISRDLVHPITKDYKGGILIKSTKSPTSPLRENDVIIRMNGERVETDIALVQQTTRLKQAGPARLDLIRGQKVISVKVNYLDHTEALRASNQSSIQRLCPLLKSTDISVVCQKYRSTHPDEKTSGSGKRPKRMDEL